MSLKNRVDRIETELAKRMGDTALTVEQMAADVFAMDLTLGLSDDQVAYALEHRAELERGIIAANFDPAKCLRLVAGLSS
jgi:hypothetical protein